jgi:hypothetical protein
MIHRAVASFLCSPVPEQRKGLELRLLLTLALADNHKKIQKGGEVIAVAPRAEEIKRF